ncbi:MAG: tRNA glutamyl-Q(34) synthetase GluQRS [Rhabdaerophilum sp.]
MQPVFRFAPSPNGHLHLGHAYSALLNARLARESGGRFLVRIEDIDTARCTPQRVADCLEDLAWLGLEWEEPVLRQSRETARYQASAETLRTRGLIYPCFCTRSDISKAVGNNALRDPDGASLYPGTCRHLSQNETEARIAGDEAFALRLDSRRAIASLVTPLDWRERGEGSEAAIPADPAIWGDVVLVRKDIPTSYHLAVVLDDAMQGVTHVVRGRDLYHATSIHRLLQTLLGLHAPVYHHHALIVDDEGRKLSKSAVSTPLRQLRAEGTSAGEIRQRLGFS